MHQNLLAEFLSEFDLRVLDTEIDPDCITVSTSSTRSSARCPQCHHESSKVYSGYVRTVADLPFGARKVILHLDIRRFFCTGSDCERVAFAEQIRDLTIRYARRTNQLYRALREIDFESGGEGGARMVKKLHYGQLSPNTLLRIIRDALQDDCPTPRYLGVDDWAMKKGCRCGTILVDLERRAIVDLLPDRTSDVLKKWLKAHPGVEIITRDRSGSYSEGVKQGAPNANQIADRFHLLVNLSDVLRQIVQHNPGILKLSQEPKVSSTSENAPKEPPPMAKQPEAPAISASLGLWE